MPKFFEQLLAKLSETEYHTAEEIAASCGIGEKTVRKRLRELNDSLKSYGAEIISKQHYGYLLDVYDREAYNQFLLYTSSQEQIPTTSEERVLYILALLLNHEDYIKLENIGEFLYVSRNTVTADLKKVEYILAVYQLGIERRPNYGIRIVGSEFDKRTCYANSIVKINRVLQNREKTLKEQKIIGDILLKFTLEYRLKMSEISFQSLVIHFYVALKRMEYGKAIVLNKEEIEEYIGSDIYKMAESLAKQLEIAFQRKISSDETAYLAVHLGAKLSSDASVREQIPIKIASEIDQLSLRLILCIYDGFKIDFRDDLLLRMTLNKHLVPLDIRMRYGIPMQNPLKEEIKQEYPLAFMMALQSGAVLKEHYKKKITEDEAAYLAVIYQFALEQREQKIDKKNIVIVCASGKGSSQLFIYRYKQDFGKYVDKIYECTAFELGDFDFSKVDYVFTTIPLNISIPVPVFEVSLFLNGSDVAFVKKTLESSDEEFLRQYYFPELFFTDVEAESKEEVLRILYAKASRVRKIPEGFYEAVLKREEMGQTDFGNYTAIPHPFYAMTEESFVVVGVLKKAVWWGHNDVRLVLLWSLSVNGDEYLQKFYRSMTDFLFDAEKINIFLKNPEFDNLIKLLV